MKFLRILRASALFILASAFYGQPVICGFFKGLLSSKKTSSVKVSEVSENLDETSVVSSSQHSDPDFQSGRWNNSHLASALAFLEEFCRKVNANAFKTSIPSEQRKDLSKSCSKLSSTLKPVTMNFLSNDHGSRYKDTLKADEFDSCIDWLKKNVVEIVTSMMNMHDESIKLTKEQLMTNDSVGPYKYGFVQKDEWWTGIISYYASGDCNKSPNLIDALKGMQESLQKILPGHKRKKTSEDVSSSHDGINSAVNQEEPTASSQVDEHKKVNEAL